MIENTYLPSVSAFFRALSRKKKILFIMLCASFFSFSAPVHAEQQRLSYDVVIAGEAREEPARPSRPHDWV